MQLSNLLQPLGVGVLGPAAEQLPALLLHLRVREIRGAADTQPLQQRLVGEGSLESWAGVLDESVQDDEGADLAVHIAVLELLPDGAGGLAGARSLELDHLDELGDAAEILLLVGLTREVLDGDRHRRVRFFLSCMSVFDVFAWHFFGMQNEWGWTTRVLE